MFKPNVTVKMQIQDQNDMFFATRKTNHHPTKGIKQREKLARFAWGVAYQFRGFAYL
jgi:hypothetical protein